MGIGAFILLLAAGVGIFWEQLPLRLVLPYLLQEPISIKGEIREIQFAGSKTGDQTYFVYLPEGYKSGDQRFKTLYHLHGAFIQKSWLEYECKYIGSKIENAASAGIIEPMIVVCPFDPEGNQMWSNSYDGKYLASSALTEDLIPNIDLNYRTIASRSGRVLQGFSMGGFGAITNGFRSPELFSSIVVWDGALHDWETLSENRESIAKKMFASEDYFNKWSPHTLMKNSAGVEMEVFMIVGQMEDTRNFASRFRPHVESSGRDITYFDSPCPHSIFCMMNERGDDAFSFMKENF